MYWWFAARELRRRNIHNAFKLNLFESARHIKGAWSFVWSTNIAHSIWSARNSCSTVLVGIVLGPAAAGLFKIAMTSSTPPERQRVYWVKVFTQR